MFKTLEATWAAMTGTPVGETTPEMIASGLSRIPRWQGRTVLDQVGSRWSVLQHILACCEVHKSIHGRLCLLLHDVEEYLMGDVPRPVKTPHQSEEGERIRRLAVHQVFGLPYDQVFTPAIEEVWRGVDADVAAAEANILMPPAIRHHFLIPTRDAERAVWSLVGADPREQVYLFLNLWGDMQTKPLVKRLKERA